MIGESCYRTTDLVGDNEEEEIVLNYMVRLSAVNLLVAVA